MYRQIVDEDPQNAEAWHLIGTIAQHFGRSNKAIDCYNKAIAIDNGQFRYHANLAVAQFTGGLTDEAKASIQQAKQSGLSDPDLLNSQGIRYMNEDQVKAAIACFILATEIKPTYADGYYNLGIAYTAQQQVDEAISAYQQAIQFKPDYAEAHNNLGDLLMKQGRHGEAIASFQAAVQHKPDHAKAYYNMGRSFRQVKNAAAAAEAFQRALSVQPDFPRAQTDLASVLSELGRDEEARLSYARLNASTKNAQNNLVEATNAMMRGQFDEAERRFQLVLQNNANNAGVTFGLAEALRYQGKFGEAESHYRTTLRLDPNYAEAYVGLGATLTQQYAFEDARMSIELGMKNKPDFADAYLHLGDLQREQGQVAEAVASYEKAAQLNPQVSAALTQCGVAQQENGNVASAVENYQQALLVNPNDATAYYRLSELARHGHYQFTPQQGERIQSLLGHPALPLLEKYMLHFAVANMLDMQGRYDDAFVHLQQANEARRMELHRAGVIYDIERQTRHVDEMIATATPDFFRQVASYGSDSDRPVFVVGAPRSGTTLVEQILASHPQVRGAGELQEINLYSLVLPRQMETERTYPSCLAQLDRETVQRLAKRYLDRSSAPGDSASRVVDRLPANYLHLGLIYAMFPQARVIYCRRDPRDLGLSCYFQNFSRRPAASMSTNLTDIGKYLRQNERLMAHWKSCLPISIHEVVYEDLVSQPLQAAQRLVQYCGLAWDDRCGRPHETARLVQSDSSLQVRQPIFASSVGRWQKYASHLQPLLKALNGEA